MNRTERFEILDVSGDLSRKDAAQVHLLVSLTAAEERAPIEVTEAPLILGRGSASSVVIDDSSVSGQHGRLRSRAGQLIFEDLGSTNGSFVNGERITSAATVAVGSILHLGKVGFRYELRDRNDLSLANELNADLKRAATYVEALLPPPGRHGSITTDWKFVPSSKLGGDAFGYGPLGSDRFALFLIDVCGHGVGAALHSVSIVNALRQRTLPDTDFSSPAQVLERLNQHFPMESHGLAYFTIWYGVMETSSRRLRFSSAGHPAAIFDDAATGTRRDLATRGTAIGLFEGSRYEEETLTCSEGSQLMLFSDGVFEITEDGRDWTREDFLALLPREPGSRTVQDLYDEIHARADRSELEDDFSLVQFRF